MCGMEDQGKGVYNLCVVWCLLWNSNGMNPKMFQGEIGCISLFIF